MRTITAIIISIMFASHAAAQCGGGGCCQGGSCGPGGCGSCGPMMYYGPPQQQYRQPQQQQPRQQIEPDGIQTPQVGSPGTPQFHPCPPPGSNPTLQTPPPVQTPPMPPAPALDPQIFTDLSAGQKAQLEISGKILEAIKSQPGCTCNNEKLEAKIDTLIQTNQTLNTTINNLTIAKPPATDKPAAPVGEPRYYLHAVPLN